MKKFLMIAALLGVSSSVYADCKYSDAQGDQLTREVANLSGELKRQYQNVDNLSKVRDDLLQAQRDRDNAERGRKEALEELARLQKMFANNGGGGQKVTVVN